MNSSIRETPTRDDTAPAWSPPRPPLHNLPASMREARRWLLWRAEPDAKTDKPRKTPYYVTGTKRHGKMDTPEDRAQMATFADACAALDGGDWSGLGFALGPDDTGAHWQGIDLDHLSEHPELSDVAADLPGYVEWSPSGDGLHAIGCGLRFPALGNNKTGIEAYASGRYFTITGDIVGGWIEDISGFVADRLRPLHKPHVEPKTEPKTEAPHTAGTEPDDLIRDLRSALWHIDADEYASWISTGLALKKLGSQGRALWLEWSSTSDKFDAADAAKRWDGFEPTSTDYRAIFAEAQRSGWINPKKRDRDAEPPRGEAANDGETEPRRIRLITPDEMANRPPVGYRIKGVLPETGLASIYGPPKSGKSFLVMDAICAVTEGRPWFGHRTKPCPVVYVALEGQAGVGQRWQAYRTVKGEAGKERLRFVEVPISLLLVDDIADLVEVIKSQGMDTGIVVIDTLIRAAPGADENSPVDMGKIIAGADSLQRALGGLVLLIHHSGKDVSRGLRGHSSLYGALDAIIEVSRDHTGARAWELGDAKDFGSTDPAAFKLAVVELGEDEDGEPITSCVIETDDAPRERKKKMGKNESAALPVICKLLKASTDYGQGEAPDYRPCVTWEAAVEAVCPALAVEPKRKRERAGSAIRGLCDAGELVQYDGWLWLP